MIRALGIWKTYRRYRRPSDRLKEILLRRPFHTDFTALRNVDLSVAPGEAVGIIGPNGAGKSTLLRILTGATLPERGHVEVDGGGRIALLTIGTGFNPQLPGWDNIALGGRLLGLDDRRIDALRPAIVDFAELGDFIHEPVATYSTGMAMRLGFSVAIHAEPACFIVDEALAVGDAHFSAKCIARLREYRARGGGLVLASHDLGSVKLLCDRALLLHHGEVAEQGEPGAVCDRYNFLVARLNEQGTRFAEPRGNGPLSYGLLDARIERVAAVGDRSGGHVVTSGETGLISVEISCERPVDRMTVGILIRDRFGQDVFGTNTFFHAKEVPLVPGRRCRVDFSLRFDLGPGAYSITAALHRDENHLETCYHWRDDMAELIVQGIDGPRFIGMARLVPGIAVHSLDP